MPSQWNVEEIQGEIIAAALKQGVDPILALAIAHQEDPTFNPRAVGDKGTSFGVFQLHRGGELGHLTPEQAFNVTTNANVALSRVRAIAVKYPHLSPGEIAVRAQRPLESIRPKYIQGVNSAYMAYSKSPPPALVAQLHGQSANLPHSYTGGALDTVAGARAGVGGSAAAASNDANLWAQLTAPLSSTADFFRALAGPVMSIGSVADWILKLFIPTNFTRIAAGITGTAFFFIGLIMVVKDA